MEAPKCTLLHRIELGTINMYPNGNENPFKLSKDQCNFCTNLRTEDLFYLKGKLTICESHLAAYFITYREIIEDHGDLEDACTNFARFTLRKATILARSREFPKDIKIVPAMIHFEIVWCDRAHGIKSCSYGCNDRSKKVITRVKQERLTEMSSVIAQLAAHFGIPLDLSRYLLAVYYGVIDWAILASRSRYVYQGI